MQRVTKVEETTPNQLMAQHTKLVLPFGYGDYFLYRDHLYFCVDIDFNENPQMVLAENCRTNIKVWLEADFRMEVLKRNHARKRDLIGSNA